MFKSLLRTIPSLSGNLTLACKIDEINKLNNDNFDTYVRNAIIIPLQNKYYSKKIDINMYRGKWESDVSHYYLYYSDHFYEENFDYLKDDYKYIDLTTNNSIDSRNKDYEFGCKRINYAKLGYQFQFYAPFYIDDVNNFPEYFKIFVQLTPTITKSIKIYIGKNNARNFILNYLKNYVSQIDKSIIHINQYNALGTYYGIDAKNGGFVKQKYSLSNLMDKHIFSSKFDEFINAGFKNNNLIVKQIIPLSFLFNIDDLLTLKEQKFFHYNKCKIYGAYYDEYDNKLGYYDFNIDYTNTQIYVNKYNSNKFIKSLILSENIYGTGSDNKYNYFLNENNNTENKYTNKITPTFNKWKLLGSTDEYPYIINNSPNFILQNPQYSTLTYHEFPINIDKFNINCIVENGNLLLPVNKTIYNKYNKDEQGNTVTGNYINKNLDLYIKAYENLFNIFTIVNDEDLNSDKLFLKKEIWADVFNYSSFYKNILYNFLPNDEINKLSFDKFGVLMNLKVTTNPSIKTSKYIIEKKNLMTKNVYVTDDIYSLTPSNIYNFTPGIEKNAFVYENENFESSIYEGNYIVNDNIDTPNKFIIWQKSDNVVIPIHDLIPMYNDIVLNNEDKITGFIKLDVSQYDILQIAYTYKKKQIIGLYQQNAYEKLIANQGNNIYVSVSNQSSKVHIKYMIDDIISEFELVKQVIEQTEKNTINEYTEQEYQQRIDNIFKEEINSSVSFNLYLKNENIVSTDTLNKIIHADSITYLLNNKGSYGKYYDELLERQNNAIIEYLTQPQQYEYVPMNNIKTNAQSEYFKQCETHNKRKVYCDYVNVIELSNLHRDNFKYDKSPYIALIKCNNEDQIECYVEHILKYVNGIEHVVKDGNILKVVNKIDKIYEVTRELKYNSSTGILDYEIHTTPIEECIIKDEQGYDLKYTINLLPNVATYWEYDPYAHTYTEPTINNPHADKDIYNYVTKEYNEHILKAILSYELKLHKNNLFLPYLVYDLNDELINILTQNKETDKECFNHSFFLYTSDYELITNTNKLIIGQESIKNNYKDTSFNYESIMNYLKTTEKKTVNDEEFIFEKGYDFKYCVYLENWKEYTWDEITPLDEHIENFIRESHLYNIIREKTYKLIIDNFNFDPELDRNIYASLEYFRTDNWGRRKTYSDTWIIDLLTTIGAPKDGKPYSIWEEGELKYQIDNNDLSIFTIEDIVNIISCYMSHADENDKTIRKELICEIIDDKLIPICKNIVERIYNGVELGVDCDSTYTIGDIKYRYLLEHILDIDILKKYEVNIVKNNKYILKEYNGIKYFYILFDFLVDNRISSYNVYENDTNSLYVNSINGEEFSLTSFKKYFDYILPIYKSNIINTFLNAYKDIISIPKNNVLKNSIILKSINDDLIKDNFDSLGYGDDKTIWESNHLENAVISRYSINRYFGYITPLFVKVNDSLKNIFSLKYKNIVKNINSDIFYKDDINIYKYNPIRIYSLDEHGKTKYITTHQYEYKHFNDNNLYNLEPVFKISDNTLYRYEELLEREKYEVYYDKFKEYICDKIKYVTQNSIDKDILLFLFNKYQVTFESKFEKFDSSDSVKLYRLTYVYKLI